MINAKDARIETNKRYDDFINTMMDMLNTKIQLFSNAGLDFFEITPSELSSLSGFNESKMKIVIERLKTFGYNVDYYSSGFYGDTLKVSW